MKQNEIVYICAVIIFSFFSACTNDFKNTPEKISGELNIIQNAKTLSADWPANNTLVVQVISEPENLHPTNGNSSPRQEILQYTQKTLLNIDFLHTTLTPGIVKSLPLVSPDGLSYTYTLKENISWDDGNQLTSGDVAFTAKAFSCPLTNDPSVKLYWKNVDDVKVIDSHTFIFIMKKRSIQNLSFLASLVVLERKFHDPENILQSYSVHNFNDTAFTATAKTDIVKWAAEFNDDKYGRDPQKLNGLGEYKVQEWNSGQYITLVKKINHWTQHSKDYHDVAYPDKIIYRVNRDDASQILQFRNQETDFSNNISVNTFSQLSAEENFKNNYNSAMMPTYNYSYVGFNERPDGERQKEYFTDVNVRKAFAMLVPVKELMKIVYKNYSDQCRRMITNVSPLKKEFDHTLKEINYNSAEAELILEKAGWKDSDNDGIRDKIINGKNISLTPTLLFLSTSPDWKDMALLIREEMLRHGINLNIESADLKTFVEKAKAHDFDLLLGSWGGTILPEDYTQLWHTSSWLTHGSNYTGFGNNTTDNLIDSIKYQLNDSLRFQLSHELQKYIYDDQPYVFLFSSMRRNIIHKRFGEQVLFSERPGILLNTLRLLSINKGITMTGEVTP